MDATTVTASVLPLDDRGRNHPFLKVRSSKSPLPTWNSTENRLGRSPSSPHVFRTVTELIALETAVSMKHRVPSELVKLVPAPAPLVKG
jgi:hypothetical protein